MAIRIFPSSDGSSLLLAYQSDDRGDWIKPKLDSYGFVALLRRVFVFDNQSVVEKPDPDESWGAIEDATLADDIGDYQDEHNSGGLTNPYVFRLGTRNGDYFAIDRNVVGTTNRFYFHCEIDFRPKMFYAERHIGILAKIDRVVSRDVYIGGDHREAISLEHYETLLGQFPTSAELNRYADARVARSIAEYFEHVNDVETAYQEFLNRRLVVRQSTLPRVFRTEELAKFRALHDKLVDLLANRTHDSMSERQWQTEIVEFIRLVYPKYICALQSVRINDPALGRREIDILLVDFNGNVDVVEIKKPFDSFMVTERQYRRNHIPQSELSGTIMQTEKYIYCLSRLGASGEARLNRTYQTKIPNGVTLKVTNPHGLIIAGRDDNLNNQQKEDFDLIRRKYRNMLDIVTYDDLLRRLNTLVTSLESS